MSDLAFEIRDLRRRLGNFTLGIRHLALEKGYVLGLLGRNGAGRSSTIGTLLNLIHPDRGQVTVLGMQMPGAEGEIRQRVGFVPEQPGRYDDLNAD